MSRLKDIEQIIMEARSIVNTKSSKMEDISIYNTEKVLKAFAKFKVADYYFKASNGYAYSDMGREVLDNIYAEIFGAQSALVRTQFVSGTHALAVALLGVLQSGDTILSATGTPYDTMQTVIGHKKHVRGSLVDMGVSYAQVELKKDGTPDLDAIAQSVNDNTTMVFIQRSRGYSSRPSLNVEQIGNICKIVKNINPNTICFVDNCYGEFTETKEPTEVGADLIAGSLIKNPGGGLAPTGGYIVGRSDLVEAASYRLTAPGLGADMGASLGDSTRLLYQGLFLAPHVVMQALKGAIFTSAVFAELGYEVFPTVDDMRSDIIQAINFGTKEKLLAFCQAIQRYSPVDSHVLPVGGDLPGYEDSVVMAAGTFVQGASIELSADAPLREPFRAYLQGGLTYEHVLAAVRAAARDIVKIQLLLYID